MRVYYEIMEQIIRQLVFDQLAVGKHLLQDLCVVGRPPTPSHPHTHACLVMREKQFLCACLERSFRHTRGREQSERWREKKWISTNCLFEGGKVINPLHVSIKRATRNPPDFGGSVCWSPVGIFPTHHFNFIIIILLLLVESGFRH
jgi:hypothetical protein